MNLADWGAISPNSALPGYTGPSTDAIVDQGDPSKYFTLGYYADQIAQFQATLIQLDQSAQVLSNMLADPNVSTDDANTIQVWLSDYASKKSEIQATAATVNAVVNTANSFGAGVPNVTLPQTLSQLPAIAVVGVAAAIAAAAAIVAWAAEKIITAQQITQQLQSIPPDQRAAALAQIEAASPSTLGSIASIVQWIAIGALIWFGYKAWTDYRGARSLAGSAA